MAFLAAAMPWVSAGVGALSTMSEGQAANQQSRLAARRLRLEAGQERAVAQHSAADVEREARRVESSARAQLAASGAGGVGAERILGNIAAEGEYRALAELYGGEARARGLEDQARVTRYQGRLARRASVSSAVGEFAGAVGGSETMMDDVQTFYDRYKSRKTELAHTKSMIDAGPY